MSRILMVCHRYAPFPGGTEIYVRNMAEELLSRKHDVMVLAQTHDPEVLKAGHYNGVAVTNDHNVLKERFDLIVVHGGDVYSQNIVHTFAGQLPSPVLYMIIKPSESPTCVNGLQYHDFLGYSTNEDYDIICKYGQQAKAVRVRHGIRAEDSRANTFSVDYHHRTFVSAGGFWAHKGMNELVGVFKEVYGDDPKVQLRLYGYDRLDLCPPTSENVIVYWNQPRSVIMDAIAGASLYVMNSTEEGFGLVLLEAMINKTPWAARNIAGALELRDYGFTYKNRDGLAAILARPFHGVYLNSAYNYVMENHLISNTVDDIEKVLAK